MNDCLTHHTHHGLTLLHFGILLHPPATSSMLIPLVPIGDYRRQKEIFIKNLKLGGRYGGVLF